MPEMKDDSIKDFAANKLLEEEAEMLGRKMQLLGELLDAAPCGSTQCANDQKEIRDMLEKAKGTI